MSKSSTTGMQGAAQRWMQFRHVLCALLVGIASSSLAVPPPNGVADAFPPAGGFAIDGNLMANNPAPGIGDWLPGTNGSGGAVLNSAGQPVDPAITFHFIDPYGNGGADLIFAGGLKWTDNPNTWQWTTGKPSSKAEINNVLMHIATDTNGHVWTVVAADRASTSGDSYIDFEFLQNPLYRTNGGRFVSTGPQGGRTTNDLLLSLAFTSGGKVADFFAWRWLPNGAGGYAYVDVTASLPAGRVFVALNSNTIAVPYGAFGQTVYAPNAFAEAALDMTALLGNFDPCLSLGFKTIMVKTKSSASSTASIEDFIEPIQYTLQIGPAANAGPDQSRCSEGDTTVFPLNGKAFAGLYPVASTAWSVVSGTAAIEAPDSLTTTARVAAPGATLRLTVTEVSGCVETDDVVLQVKPLPAGSIAGPSSVCPLSASLFQAPAGMDEYHWTISGNGSLIGATNAATVTVVAGGDCGSAVALSVAVVSNGCSSTLITNVIVADATAPTIACPPNLVLECPADTRTNATGVATAQDDCGHATLSYTDAIAAGCGGSKVISRTWTATDLCGNSTNAVQTITVQDTHPPVLTCPPSLVLECPADTSTNATGAAIARDECSAFVISFTDTVTNQCGNTKVIVRLWTATDACGNHSSAAQTITVRDTTKPTLRVPPNLVLECPADSSTNATGVATAQDACSQVVVTFADSVSNYCGGAKVIARTWTATDECGNASQAVQTITVRDTTPPVVTAPPSLVLECPADTRTNVTGVATAQDACSAVVVTYTDITTNGCGGTKVIARTWIATDECGNASRSVQTITVRDTTPPILTVPPSLVLECPADTRTNVTGVAIAQDACSAVVITYADMTTNGCGGTKAIARTWTATDECGNQSSAVQTITVRDSIRPTLVIPPNLVLECPADTGTNATGSAVAQDGCSAATVRFTDATTNICGGARVILRTWTASDACGNSTNAVQTITLRDTTAPTLACPPNLVLECPADTRTNSTGMATAQDACSSVVIGFTDSVSNNCGGTKIISRLWTATDSCGNQTNAIQTILVRDTRPPTLILPANLVLECPVDTRTNVTGVPIAQDGCGAVTVSYSDVVSNSCGATKTVLRLWTAVDQCGNATNGLQVIAVVDTQKPTIVSPAVTVQCAGDVPPAYTNLAAFLAAGGRASDACDSSLTFALIGDSGLVGSCPGKVTRVYRVTDACGNFAESTQVITVHDTIAPRLTCPTNVVVACKDVLDLAVTGRATATDNCDANVNVSYTDAVVPSAYNIKWYAADPTPGNAPFLPTYLKLAPGSLGCPDSARLTGRAADPLRNAVAYGPTASTLDALTSLGAEPMALGQIVPFEVVIGMTGGPGPEHGTIEFTGAWSTHTTSNDEFGYDKNYMVYCAFVDTADPGTLDPDNNARVDSFSSTLVNAGTIDEKIQGTFRVSGLDVGDRIVVEIWVVLKSTMPGKIGGTIAADLVSAEKVVTPPEPISTGNQTVSIGNLSKFSQLPPPQEQPPLPTPPPQPPTAPGRLVSVIDRTWTAADSCGNQSSCVQRLTVRDSAPPIIAAPPGLVLEWPADTRTNATGVATAQDDCGPASISFSDTVTNQCGGTETIARTWTATDAVGNHASAVQTIVVQDTTPPVVVAPPDVILQSPADAGTNNTGVATAQDANGVASLIWTDVTNSPAAGSQLINRTWTATDICGNSATAVQTITILPAPVAPSIVSAPACQLIGCSTSTTLTVAATGSGPLSYQWRFNGTDIAGATNSSLRLNSLQFTNAGLYTVVISNSAGTVTTPATVVNVAPRLSMLRAVSGGSLVWPAGFALQSAPTPSGPYADVAGASSPYPWNPAAAPQKYFRLRSLPFQLSMAPPQGGLGRLTVTGSPGWNFTLQASTDLKNWVNLTTNTAPCSFIDVDAALYPMRFYRAVPTPAAPLAPVAPPTPRVTTRLTKSNLTLEWPATLILQAAPTPIGPFVDLQGVSSPLVLDTTVAPQRYFRLKPSTP